MPRRLVPRNCVSGIAHPLHLLSDVIGRSRRPLLHIAFGPLRRVAPVRVAGRGLLGVAVQEQSVGEQDQAGRVLPGCTGCEFPQVTELARSVAAWRPLSRSLPGHRAASAGQTASRSR